MGGWDNDRFFGASRWDSGERQQEKWLSEGESDSMRWSLVGEAGQGKLESSDFSLSWAAGVGATASPEGACTAQTSHGAPPRCPVALRICICYVELHVQGKGHLET